MKNQKVRMGVSDVVLLVISVIFAIGIRTFFKPCGPKDDGSWMSCHWAGNAIAGLAVVLVVVALIHLIIANGKIKMGLSFAILPIAVLSAVIPGHVIGLCMMDTMRCRAVMTPAVILLSVLMIAAAVFDIIVYRKKG